MWSSAGTCNLGFTPPQWHLATPRTAISARSVAREYFQDDVHSTSQLTRLRVRPMYTTVDQKPGIMFVKGGAFRKSGTMLPAPFKEQWCHRAEKWEHKYAPKDQCTE